MDPLTRLCQQLNQFIELGGTVYATVPLVLEEPREFKVLQLFTDTSSGGMKIGARLKGYGSTLFDTEYSFRVCLVERQRQPV